MDNSDIRSNTVRIDAYAADQFPFSELMAPALTLDEVNYLDPDYEVSPTLETLGQLRSQAHQLMRSEKFQECLARFCVQLVNTHFGNTACYFQRVPSIRLFAKGAHGTSWHTDNWYGHPPGSRTFWLPLTPVAAGSGVCFIDDELALSDLEQDINNGLSLSMINSVCAPLGREIRPKLGEYISFGSRTLHGSVENLSGSFRCSIDFRASPVNLGVGNKPLDNYRIVDSSGTSSIEPAHTSVKAAKYINGALSASPKSQHVLMEEYAKEHGLQIVRNEAEIETAPSRPVLLAYSRRDVPLCDNYDHLLLPSFEALPKNFANRKKILENCLQNRVTLHFALEDKIYPTTTNLDISIAESVA